MRLTAVYRALWLAAAGLVAVPGRALAEPGSGNWFMPEQTTVSDFFRASAETWADNAAPYVMALFGVLFIADVAVIYLDSVNDRAGPEVTFSVIARRLVIGGFCLVLLLNPRIFAFPLIDAFEWAGLKIGGSSASKLPDPRVLMVQGWKIMVDMMSAVIRAPLLDAQGQPIALKEVAADAGIKEALKAIWLLGRWLVMAGPYLFIVMQLAFFVWAAFIIMALQVTLIKAEAYLMIALGLILLPSAGSPLASGLAAAYGRLLVRTAMRLFLTSAMFGLYYIFVEEWKKMIVRMAYPDDMSIVSILADMTAGWMFEFIGSVWLVTYLVWKIPNKYGIELTQDIRFESGKSKREG